MRKWIKMALAFAASGTLLLSLLGKLALAESYEDYMKRVQEDMKEAGMQTDAFAQNPFQTGTALSGYYLSEKTLLLERDAFFQMKTNKLETTEEVADFQHRARILRAHGNNMLLQLLQAVDQRNKEGFVSIEKPKHEADLEALIAACEKDAACVADRLANPETSFQNILVDNFALATQVFGQVPYMHVVEVNSVYQLIQLIYLEVFYSQNLLSSVEFAIFRDKQEKIRKSIERNDNLTPAERELHAAMLDNTLNKWKKRVLERRFDHTEEFERKAAELRERNQASYAKIQALRNENPEVLGGLHNPKENCWDLREFKERPWCEARKKLMKRLETVSRGERLFAAAQERKLPKDFWE